MATDASRWAGEVMAIFAKDARSEYRSRAAVNAILLFALTTLAVISFSVSTQGLAPGIKARILSALLWIILFFASMSGLPRVFVKEEDTRTAMALRLSARPSVVFVGKLLFNVVLLLAVGLAVVPLYVILMSPVIAAPANPPMPIRSTVTNWPHAAITGDIRMT